MNRPNFVVSHLLFSFGRWVDNIKMDPREIGRNDMDWIYLAQDTGQWRALVNTTGSGVHPTSYPMDTGGCFPGGKADGA
jgi:hypothetical protein